MFINRKNLFLFYLVFNAVPGVSYAAPVQVPAKPIVQDAQIAIVYEVEPSPVMSAELVAVFERFHQSPTQPEVLQALFDVRESLFDYVDIKLADSSSLNIGEAQRLLMALSMIDDDRALTNMLVIGRKFINVTSVSQQLLLLLRELPVNKQVLSYVDELIRSNLKDVVIVRSALLYYAAGDIPEGLRWASMYRSPNVNPELRFAALYLSAVLQEDVQVARWLLELLVSENSLPTYQQYYLMLGLGRVLLQDEFKELQSKFNIAPSVKQAALRHLEFIDGDDSVRESLIDVMLASAYPEQRRLAIGFLLQQQKLAERWEKLDNETRLTALRMARTLGLGIWPIETQIELEDNLQANAIYIAIAFLLVLALWGFMGYRFRCTSFNESQPNN